MTQANSGMTVLQQFILELLCERGYQAVERNRFMAARILRQPVFTTKFHVGKGIYGTEQYCDFICYHPELWPDNLIIESKWQKRSGSVDEKYPYLVLNIQNHYSCPTVLVLDGGGYKKGAEGWIRAQVGRGKFKHVFDMTEFRAWADEGKL